MTFLLNLSIRLGIQYRRNKIGQRLKCSKLFTESSHDRIRYFTRINRTGCFL